MLSTISKILNAPLYQISSYYDYIVDISNGKLLFLKRPDQMWTYHKPRIDKLKIYFFCDINIDDKYVDIVCPRLIYPKSNCY
jgi:hypothetical protein